MSGVDAATRCGFGAIACGMLALFALAFAPVPGDERILGRDDLAYVRALVRNGYPDLAEELLKTLESGKSRSKDDGLMAQALRLQLAEAAAYNQPDPLRQGEALQLVVSDMEQFVADHPGTAATEEISDRLLELYRGFGERVANLLANPDTAADAKSMRGTGGKMFERAIETLKTEREELQTKRDALDEPDPELERRAMIVAYNLARAFYYHAQILDDEFTKKVRYKNALDVLADIQLEFSDQLLCYEGYVYEGLCNKDLGKLDEALESFDYAIQLREKYEPGPNDTFKVAPDAADIISSATLQKMLLLIERGDNAAAAEVARDFYATIPDAGQTLRGLSILSNQAEALKAAGDQKGVQAVAAKLIELDPRGPGGERGRELLGAASEGSLGAVDTYRLANSAAQRGETERAIALAQQAMIGAKGTADEANLGAQSCLLLGAVYAGRGWMHEAVVAWSGVLPRYAKGKEAPECLWRAANGYQALQKEERGGGTFYKDAVRETMSQLASRYTDHPYASKSAIIEGQQLEADEEYEKAAEVYLRIPEGNASHEESQYRAGSAWAGQMRKLFKAGKADQAKAAAAKAEDLLKKARTALEKSAAETLDVAAQDRMRGLAFNSRVALANVYLAGGVDKAAQVIPLFDGVEREFPGDTPKAASARALRLRALQALGKVDEAAQLLDQQLKDEPSGKGLGQSAGALARAFDQRGEDARKEGKTVESETLLRRAATYYGIAIRGQVEGSEAVRLDELEPIANRLFALALKSNGVPDAVQSFTEFNKKLDEPLLELVVRAYQTLLDVTPSYKAQIVQAQALGYLQRWDDASEAYAALFARESFVNMSTKTIDNAVLRDKPELAFALAEWGVCEREIGVARNLRDRISRANGIFTALVTGMRPDTKLWWLAKYYFALTLSDQGEYDAAQITVRELLRNYPEYDGGILKERFERLAKELEKKASK